MLAFLIAALFTSNNAFCTDDIYVCADGSATLVGCDYSLYFQRHYCGGCAVTDVDGNVMPTDLCQSRCTGKWYSCTKSPCNGAECNVSGARCEDYCAGCNPVWVDESYNDITAECNASISTSSTTSSTTNPPCSYIDIYNPVCCGGVEYSNIGHAECECDSYNADDSTSWSAYTGECCDDYKVDCFAEPCSVSSCSIEGSSCTNNYCNGCNVIWYDEIGNDVTNQCDASTISPYTSTDTTGNTGCMYPEWYKPVCCDGITFSNKEHAKCECEDYDEHRILFWTEGECDTPFTGGSNGNTLLISVTLIGLTIIAICS